MGRLATVLTLLTSFTGKRTSSETFHDRALSASVKFGGQSYDIDSTSDRLALKVRLLSSWPVA